MGSVRKTLSFTLATVISVGIQAPVVFAQSSGIEYYAYRLGYGQASSQPAVRQASYPQLTIPTNRTPIYSDVEQRMARRAKDDSRTFTPIQRYGQWQIDALSDSKVRSRSSFNRRKLSQVSQPKRSSGRASVFIRGSQKVLKEDAKEQALSRPFSAQGKSSGVVLPPGSLDELGKPKIPGGDQDVPQVKPDRRMPRPGGRQLVDPFLPLETTDREPSSRSKSRRSSSVFDPADPRHPNANNGPDSWYRPRANDAPPVATGIHGFSDPNVYGSNMSPVIQSSPQAYSSKQSVVPSHSLTGDSDSAYMPVTGYGSLYSDSCQPTCTGTAGFASGGCNSCGTGIVNGCQESMFYLSLFGGYTNMESVNVTDSVLGEFLFSLDDGYGLGIALGQYQGTNLRTEFEFSFRENGLETLTMPGNPLFVAPPLANAGIRSYSGMANVLWEFVEFQAPRLKPYVGAGFGFVNVEIEAALNGANALGGTDGSDSSFGYQWMAGLNFRINESLDLFAEYRFLKADSLQLGNFGFDYETSNVFGGARIKF